MQKKFTEKDSSLSFILSIVLPNVLAVMILIIAGFFTNITKIEGTKFYKIMATTINQIAFLLIFIFIARKNKINLKNSIEWEKLNFKQIIILVLISFVCLLLISPLVNVFDAILAEFGVVSPELPININKPINFIYLILTMGIFAPICEELLFRGVVLGGLKQKGNKTAVLVSSLMFMLIHLNLNQTIYQFLLGIILALVVLYTGNILSSILIHFINNTFVLVINYINPNLFAYNFMSSNYIFLAIVLFVLALVILFILLKMLKNLKHNKQKGKIEVETKNVENNLQTNNYNIKHPVLLSLIFGIVIWFITVIMSL